jgi:hypothetical protein
MLYYYVTSVTLSLVYHLYRCATNYVHPRLHPLPPRPPDDSGSVPPSCVVGLLAGSCSLIVEIEVVWSPNYLGSVPCLDRDLMCAGPYNRASDRLESPWVPNSYPVADREVSWCVGRHSRRLCWCGSGLVALTRSS